MLSIQDAPMLPIARLFSGCLLLASPSTAAPPVSEGEAVTFLTAPLAAGTKVNGSFVSSMDMKVTISMGTMGEQTIQVKQGEESAWGASVSEPGKVALQFTKSVTTGTNPMTGEQVSNKKPVEGKSYLVARTEAGLEVKGAEGAAVPEVEANDAGSRIGASMFDSGLGEVLTKSPITPGQPISVSQDLARSVMQMDKEDVGKINEFTLTLKEIRERGGTSVGVFDAVIDLELADDQLPESIKLKWTGEIHVCTGTCRVVGLQLSGPIDMKLTRQQNGMEMGIVMTGTAAVTASNSLGAE
jgi:hypothetical protein